MSASIINHLTNDDIKKSLKDKISDKNFNLLIKSKIAIAGLGGLGSHVAILLARAYVGHIHLIDYDKIDLSNINRQAYKLSQVNMLKTDALKDIISEINPFIKVTIKNEKIDSNNIIEIFNGYSIICEAFDNAECKALLINNIMKLYPETKIVAASGIGGYLSSNKIVTEKINDNLYICGDRNSDIEIYGSLTAARVNICASHQANMIIRLILGINEI